MTLNHPKISIKKAVYVYILWWVLWAMLEAYALTTTVGLSWRVALFDSINANLIMATAGCIMYNSLYYYRPSLKNAFYLFTWSVALAVLSVLIQSYMITWNLFEGDKEYNDFFSQSIVLRGIFSWLMIALIAVLSWMWFYIQDQQKQAKREEDAAQLAREAELSSLRQQLQPHFLFNSLNSISALAGSRPEEARNMIQQLSDFLRGTIKRDNQQMVTLEEELRHLQLYLEIEKVRFGHRLDTVITQDENTMKMLLPTLLLQPIVENAIKFGLYDTIGKITIRIETKSENNYLLVSVSNPFDAETTQPKQGTGFGLNSVQRRLYLLYHRNDLLSIDKSDNVFTTIIKIPQSV